ncbi:MAG: bifunctional ornithine acetyltransferase/N-acetylglutamate synthase [Methanomassiliicoccales archaeon]|nr:bifunctional ornithine acetyltransferase/N-acetylglutamate synthase [Methanomassiliicoccales archaeon]
MKIIDGGVTAPLGWKAAGVHAGIKKEKLDLAILYSEKPAKTSIGYTQNKVKAAPVEVMMKKDPELLQAFVINSGNANALTGTKGIEDAITMIKIAATELCVEENLVGVASTGVIGRYLPMDKIAAGIPLAVKSLGRGREFDELASTAILTTDTVRKEAACQVTLSDGRTVTIGGMAKGSGMISPSMKVSHATTLSFITTDAPLSSRPDKKWQEILDHSFNMINVDGDQSTNDISVFMANGCVGGQPVDDDPVFWRAIEWTAKTLARKIAADGEGATKLIEVVVTGARTAEDARKAARAIISSNLVKAAIFGSDPNYGRIIAAVGNSNSHFDLEKMQLMICANGTNVKLFDHGNPIQFSGKTTETIARKVLSNKTITIKVDLGVGNCSAEAWGCDLSYDYVRINAQYTT